MEYRRAHLNISINKQSSLRLPCEASNINLCVPCVMCRASQDHQTINIDNSIPTVNKSIYLMQNIKILRTLPLIFMLVFKRTIGANFQNHLKGNKFHHSNEHTSITNVTDHCNNYPDINPMHFGWRALSFATSYNTRRKLWATRHVRQHADRKANWASNSDRPGSAGFIAEWRAVALLSPSPLTLHPTNPATLFDGTVVTRR